MSYFTKPPCYNNGDGCPKREVGCREKCDEWKEWQIIHQQERDKKYTIYCRDRDLDTFECQQGLRIKRLNRSRAEQEKRRR